MIPGIIASEETAHLQPLAPTMGQPVLSGSIGVTGSGTLFVYFTPNPLGHPATKYTVSCYGLINGVTYSGLGTTFTGTTSPITVTGIFIGNTNYYFQGKGFNNYPGSGVGGPWSAPSPPIEPFVATVAPTGVTATVLSKTSVIVGFNNVTGASSYIVYATISGNTTWVASGTGSSSPITLTSYNYLLGSTYSFYAESVNGAGTSAPSTPAIYNTPNPFGPPTVAPAIVLTGGYPTLTGTITPDTSSLNNLPGEGGSTPNDYVVNASPLSNASYPYSASPIVTTWSIPTTPNPSYGIYAVASNIYGSTTGGTAYATFPPPTPNTVTASVTDITDVLVSWNANATNGYSAATSFTVYCTGTDSSYFSTTAAAGTTSVTLTASYNPGILYTFYVTANTGGGTSAGSTAVLVNNHVPITIAYSVIAAGGSASKNAGGGAGQLSSGFFTAYSGVTNITDIIVGYGVLGTTSNGSAGLGGLSSSIYSQGILANGGSPGNANGGTWGNGGNDGDAVNLGGSSTSAAGGGGGGAGGAGGNGTGSGASGYGGSGGATVTLVGVGYQVAGGGRGIGTDNNGSTTSSLYGGGGNASGGNSQSGIIVLSWTIANYPTTPTVTNSAGSLQSGGIQYYWWTSPYPTVGTISFV